MTVAIEAHPQTTAVRSLLFKLQMSGFQLDMVDDGEEFVTVSGATNRVERDIAADAITSVDTSVLKVYHLEQKKVAYVTIVLGNGNHELMQDWTSCCEEIDTLLEQISEQMEVQFGQS
jgi:hypothetical protein